MPVTDAQLFIDMIAGDEPTHFRTFHDTIRSQPGHNYSTEWQLCRPMIEADQQIGYGVYMVINAGGHSDDQITHHRAAFIDIDIYHGQQPPAAWHVVPHIITERRDAAGELQAMHAYWLTQPAGDLAQWTQTQRQLAEFYGSDGVVINPSRVMRLPGTWHLKAAPSMYGIVWVSADTPRIALAALQVGLPEVSALAPSAGPRGTVLLETDDPQTRLRVATYLLSADPATEGDHGDQKTFAVAARCRDEGLPEEITLQMMWEHWNDRCSPPWSYEELAQKVTNSYAYARNPQGSSNALAIFAPQAGAVVGEDLAERQQMANYNKNHSVNATQFLMSNYPGAMLVRLQEQFYGYTGKAWAVLDDDSIKHQLTLAMLGSNPGDGTINGSFGVLAKLCHRSDLTPGVWPGREASQFLLYDNGILDLMTGQLEAHNPDYFCTTLLPYAYDPSAQCPRWIQFVNEIFNDDPDRVALLQEWLGYLLTSSNLHQKAMLLLGKPRSGKGTIGRVLRMLVGGDNYSGMTLEGLTNDAVLESILTTPVLFVGDAHSVSGPARNTVLDRFKSVTGGDEIPVTRKFKRTWRGTLPGRVTLAANDVPQFADASGALASRFLILPFDNSWLGRESLTLDAQLRFEIAGISVWALAGLARLNAAGRFTEPLASINEHRELDERYSPLQVFTAECCTLAPAGRVHTSKLYDAYRTWCMSTGQKPTHKNGFIAAMRAAYRGTISKSLMEFEGRRGQGFAGIALNGQGVTASNVFDINSQG